METYWIAAKKKGRVTGFVGASQRAVKHQITRSGEDAADYEILEVVPTDRAVSRPALLAALASCGVEVRED